MNREIDDEATGEVGKLAQKKGPPWFVRVVGGEDSTAPLAGFVCYIAEGTSALSFF